jgi:hypothetical protein
MTREELIEKVTMEPGQKCKITGNFPEFGKNKHGYEIGQHVYFVGYLHFPVSGKLPMMSNTKHSTNYYNDTRNVVYYDQFEICKSQKQK